MINIYDKFGTKNTVLNTNGLAVLDDICIKADIIEKINSEYGLVAIFTLDNINKKHEFITEEAIIKVADVYGDEVFRINKVTKRSNRQIEIYARHISYDVANLFLEDVRPTSQNGAGFLDWILTHTTTTHEFTSNSDITSTATSYFIRKTVYEALFSADKCFLKQFGGEVSRRQYNIAINSQIGSNTGVSIRSRKNLQGFEEYTDIDTVITRIYPVGKDGLTIPEKYIDSAYINNYPNIKSQEVSFSDIGIDTENGITEAMAQQQLRDAVAKMFASGCDLLKGEYKVDFVTLEKTEEYKNFTLLERTWLGDTVNVFEENYNININVRVIERNYNVLKQVHNTITLSNIAEKSMSGLNKIINIIKSITDTNTGFLQQAKENATLMINNGVVGSYVVVKKDEFLVMDNIDPSLAVKVWKWTLGGLGYSNTGINGTFETAITADGKIVADFISTGVLNANLIKAGVLKSLNEKTWISMTDGTFSFADGKITWDGTTFAINAEAVKVAVGKIGGNNLIKNSRADFGTTGWTKDTALSAFTQFNSTLLNQYVFRLSNNLNQPLGIYQTGIKLKPSTKYTLQLKLLTQYTSTTVWLAAQKNGTTGTNYDYQYIAKSNYSNSEYEVIKYTFTTASDVVTAFLRIANNGTSDGSNGYVYITDIKLEEGENATAWSANQNEIKTTDISVNEDGLTVNNGAITVKNNNNTVTIDGQYNMHKIVATGTIFFQGTNHNVTNTYTLTHGLLDDNGNPYMPVYRVFQKQFGSTVATETPAFSMTTGTTVLGFDASIRAWVDNTKIYFEYLRSNNRAANESSFDITLTYYLYRETAI